MNFTRFRRAAQGESLQSKGNLSDYSRCVACCRPVIIDQIYPNNAPFVELSMSLPESLPLNPPIRSTMLPPSPVGNMRELVRNPLGYFLAITRQYGDVICYRPEPDRA